MVLGEVADNSRVLQHLPEIGEPSTRCSVFWPYDFSTRRNSRLEALALDLWRTMQSVLDKVTPNDAANCFRRCGYSLGLG